MTLTANKLLLRDFGAWARRWGLETHRHDAQFHGSFGDARVEIETGIRDSNLYVGVITIHRRCGITPCELHREEIDVASSVIPSDPSIGRLRDLVRSGRPLSIRIEAKSVIVRMPPGSSPDEVEEIIDRVLAATRAVETSPYR